MLQSSPASSGVAGDVRMYSTGLYNFGTSRRFFFGILICTVIPKISIRTFVRTKQMYAHVYNLIPDNVSIITMEHHGSLTKLNLVKMAPI